MKSYFLVSSPGVILVLGALAKNNIGLKSNISAAHLLPTGKPHEVGSGAFRSEPKVRFRLIFLALNAPSTNSWLEQVDHIAPLSLVSAGEQVSIIPWAL